MANNNASQNSGNKEKQKPTNSQPQPQEKKTRPPERADEYTDEPPK